MRMTPCGASERSLTSCAGIVVAMASQSTSAPSGDVAELLAREKQARLERRERPYQAGMGATEDDAWRRFAAARSRRTLPEGALGRVRERGDLSLHGEALEGLLLDLAHALAPEVEPASDLLDREWTVAAVDVVTEPDHVPLLLGQRLDCSAQRLL